MFSSLNPRRNQASLEASKRLVLEATYTTPLGLDAAGKSDSNDADLHALRTFLHKFYPKFYDKSSVAKRQTVLDDHGDVASFHERLVKRGTVSEEEFWQRYYYRCDPEQILLEWERHPDRGRQVMGEAVTSWFKKTVSNSDSDVAKNSSKLGIGSTADSKPASSNQLPNDSVTWFDAKWDSVRKARVLPKEEGEDNGSISKDCSTTSEKPVTKSNKTNTANATYNDDNGNSSPTERVYIPPHKRGKMKMIDKSDSNSSITKGRVNARAERLRSQVDRAGNINKMASDGKRDITTVPNVTSTKEIQSIAPPQPTAKKDKTGSLVSIFALCCICAASILLFSQRDEICASNNPFWSPLLLCPIDAPPAEQIGIQTRPGTKKNKQVKFQNNGDLSSSPEEDYGIGNPVPQAGTGGSDGGDSLVNNLISSWMQSTDMAQLLSGSTMEQQQQQQQQHSSGNDNGIALLPYQKEDPPAKKKRGGPIQFFKRKFGRDRPTDNDANALAVNNNGYGNQGGYGALSTEQSRQPQMVVHQHIHHVVHHVVHEYADQS